MPSSIQAILKKIVYYYELLSNARGISHSFLPSCGWKELSESNPLADSVPNFLQFIRQWMKSLKRNICPDLFTALNILP
ncbi:hypothetical protein CEXT_812221 [Caerostris extrusa]|uniref:Maturase K n=1 Tax=Caerostris extrusa TaxID=172846 RepID=A0AAV4TDC1_CAEEX|nr:hypothetical protein CEXT_812221 [Caerostris extrusa]